MGGPSALGVMVLYTVMVDWGPSAFSIYVYSPICETFGVMVLYAAMVD